MKCQTDEAQAGINTAERNINNLKYADDTTLMAENEEVGYRKFLVLLNLHPQKRQSRLLKIV